MSKEKPLVPTTDAYCDGDYEYSYRLDIARDLYLKGHNIEDVSARTDIKKWTIHSLVFKGTKEEKPWVEQRRDSREEFIKECQELTKISLSKGYRTLGDTLFTALTSMADDINSNRFKPYEKIKAVEVLVKGIKEIHNLFMPAMKTPLVNIALQNNPKMTETDIVEQLIDWGLASTDGDKKAAHPLNED